MHLPVVSLALSNGGREVFFEAQFAAEVAFLLLKEFLCLLVFFKWALNLLTRDRSHISAVEIWVDVLERALKVKDS